MPPPFGYRMKFYLILYMNFVESQINMDASAKHKYSEILKLDQGYIRLIFHVKLHLRMMMTVISQPGLRL
jgi:hypothetical protein